MNIHKAMAAMEMFIVPVSGDAPKVRQWKYIFSMGQRGKGPWNQRAFTQSGLSVIYLDTMKINNKWKQSEQ